MASNSRLHVRSASLTSKTNPIIARIEKELKKIRAREASSTSTTQKMSLGLSGLGNLFRCVDDVLGLPLTQQALSLNRHSSCVNKLVEECSALLDICCNTKQIVTQLKEAAEDLQFAVTTQMDDQLSMETSTADYTSSRKKIMKQAQGLIMSLKKMDYSFGSSTVLSDEGDHLSEVLKALRCVVIISISVYESLLSFLSSPQSKPPRSNKWSITKFMQKGNVSTDHNVKPENRNELQVLDVSLWALWRSTGERVNSEKLQEATKKIKALQSEIDDIDNGSDIFSKQLVKTRASLLKIMSR